MSLGLDHVFAAKLKSNFPLDVKTLCLIIQLSKSLNHFRDPLHITWIEKLSRSVDFAAVRSRLCRHRSEGKLSCRSIQPPRAAHVVKWSRSGQPSEYCVERCQTSFHNQQSWPVKAFFSSSRVTVSWWRVTDINASLSDVKPMEPKKTQIFTFRSSACI